MTRKQQDAAAANLLPTSLERACQCARIAAENKGRDVLVLDMRKVTPITDFLVIATGASRRQMHAIAEDTDAEMRKLGDRRRGIEGYEASRWIVQDYGDVIIHIFDSAAREFYSLEELWADAPRVAWERA
jgi:ribosome-associated protein